MVHEILRKNEGVELGHMTSQNTLLYDTVTKYRGKNLTLNRNTLQTQEKSSHRNAKSNDIHVIVDTTCNMQNNNEHSSSMTNITGYKEP